jgi:hypothetical protein
LQRYDTRSAAVIDEANSIGTTYLRTGLLAEPIRGNARILLKQYVDLRVAAGIESLDHVDKRQSMLQASQDIHQRLWQQALEAAQDDPGPVTSGLYIQALNEMIDDFGTRQAALDRHVPEVVLFLLLGTLVLTGSLVGYASGVAGQRASFATYVLVLLIVLLVFIILDLDRPRRGLIEVPQDSIIELQQSIRATAQ